MNEINYRLLSNWYCRLRDRKEIMTPNDFIEKVKNTPDYRLLATTYCSLRDGKEIMIPNDFIEKVKNTPDYPLISMNFDDLIWYFGKPLNNIVVETVEGELLYGWSIFDVTGHSTPPLFVIGYDKCEPGKAREWHSHYIYSEEDFASRYKRILVDAAEILEYLLNDLKSFTKEASRLDA